MGTQLGLRVAMDAHRRLWRMLRPRILDSVMLDAVGGAVFVSVVSALQVHIDAWGAGFWVTAGLWVLKSEFGLFLALDW